MSSLAVGAKYVECTQNCSFGAI